MKTIIVFGSLNQMLVFTLKHTLASRSPQTFADKNPAFCISRESVLGEDPSLSHAVGLRGAHPQAHPAHVPPAAMGNDAEVLSPCVCSQNTRMSPSRFENAKKHTRSRSNISSLSSLYVSFLPTFFFCNQGYLLFLLG